jgi:hypothetical protein
MSKPSWMNTVPAYQFVGSPDNPRWPKDSLALAIGEFCDTEPQREAAVAVAHLMRTGRALLEATEFWFVENTEAHWNALQQARTEHGIAVLAAEKWKLRG